MRQSRGRGNLLLLRFSKRTARRWQARAWSVTILPNSDILRGMSVGMSRTAGMVRERPIVSSRTETKGDNPTMSFTKLITATAASLILAASAAQAGDAASCQKVRLSDIGWTDITATTGTMSVLLTGLGYKPDVKLLSEEVTYQGLKNKDLDIFLGDWEPSMASVIKPYLDDKSVEQMSPNLEGAKYTLAVPKYVYDGGIH